jgi:hypothetical protein
MTEIQTPTVNKFGVQPGDIYVCQWGYDETRNSFYEVVRVTATKAEVRPIGARREGSFVLPDPTWTREFDVLIRVDREDAVKTKLCTTKAGWKPGGATIVLRSGQYWAQRWDGAAQYQTPQGMER